MSHWLQILGHVPKHNGRNSVTKIEQVLIFYANLMAK